MPRRFCDSERWDKRWLRKLSPELKLAFAYILDTCDRAGYWQVDLDKLKFDLGIDITEDDLVKIKDFEIKDGWLIVKDFISFQYPKGLSDQNRAHIGVIEQLSKMKTRLRGIKDPMDKDKNKDNGKDKRTGFVPPSPEEVTVYSKEIDYPIDGEAWVDSYQQKGWMCGKSKMKDWKSAIRNWKRNKWLPSEEQEPKLSIWKLEKRKDALDEQIDTIQTKVAASPANTQHPKKMQKLLELKAQRMEIIEKIGEAKK